MPRKFLAALGSLALLGAVDVAPLPMIGAKPPNGSGCVALTFDDGPDATLTPRLLTILENENVRATFFVLGERVAANTALVKRESNDLDEIGNHTWDHRLLPLLGADQIVGEIRRTDEAIVTATGTRPDLIRPPYGIISSGVEATLRKAGLMRTVALWDIDSFDWLHTNVALTVIRASEVIDGSVILMHDVHPTTIEAVPEVIRNLQARGLRLTTFSGLAACLKAAPRPPIGEPRLAQHRIGSSGSLVETAVGHLSGGR